MKKVIVLILCASSFASASEVGIYPTSTNVIREIERQRDLNLRNGVGDPAALTPGAMLAGAVGGAVASAVEWAWDKLVGNGRQDFEVLNPKDFDMSVVNENLPMLRDQILRDQQVRSIVDKERLIKNSDVLLSPQESRKLFSDIKSQLTPEQLNQVISPEVTELIEQYHKLDDNILNDPNDPRANLVAVAAGAAAGALAYKAVEYILKKIGDKEHQYPLPLDEDFDFKNPDQTNLAERVAKHMEGKTYGGPILRDENFRIENGDIEFDQIQMRPAM